MADPTNGQTIPNSVADVLFAIGGSIIGAAFAVGRRSSQMDEQKRRIDENRARIEALESERHRDVMNTNARIDALGLSLRDEIKQWRIELRAEMKEMREEVKDIIREGGRG